MVIGVIGSALLELYLFIPHMAISIIYQRGQQQMEDIINHLIQHAVLHGVFGRQWSMYSHFKKNRKMCPTNDHDSVLFWGLNFVSV